jgi:hypothetical protein
MLEVKVIMDSSIEEILAFKCCRLPDQNLEIHVRNTGDGPVTVVSRFLLENETGESMGIDNVYPPWGQEVSPGETTAFYCSMDERAWRRYQFITAFDSRGNAFRGTTGNP